MLQDLERGRSLEIDALVTAVRDLGAMVGVPTPIIEAVLVLVQERGRQAGLYERVVMTADHRCVKSQVRPWVPQSASL